MASMDTDQIHNLLHEGRVLTVQLTENCVVQRVLLTLVALSVALATGCASPGTPLRPTATLLPPLPTAVPIIATPPPGPGIVLRAYMQLLHEQVLLPFAARAEANAELLARSTASGFSADALCADGLEGPWHHFADLNDRLLLMLAPPQANEFHGLLLDALSRAEQTAESYDWFCQTYATFGQPAAGMWGRLTQQVQACQRRMAELRGRWEAMGGVAMGWAW